MKLETFLDWWETWLMETVPPEETLLNRGLAVLRALLGSDWEVTVRPEPVGRTVSGAGAGAGAMVQLTPAGDDITAQLLVDTKSTLSPLAVREQLAPKAALLRRLQQPAQPLVIADALTERTKQELREHDISYLDLLGNVSLRLRHPTVVLFADSPRRTPHGTTKSPAGATTKPKLAGPRAGRLVRLLADVAPPYHATELVGATGISKGYVSKLLDSMEDLLLIRREGRVVTEVDWQGLLRARAEHLSVLRHNPFVGTIAPNGPGPLLESVRVLQQEGEGERVLLTGSYAAQRIAPLAVGGQVMLYVSHAPNAPYEIGERLGLLPVDHGADTLLLRAHDSAVFERTRLVGGIRQVAQSQLVLDCLSGPGRMPAEGEAVLSFMAEHEEEWRVSTMAALARGDSA